MCIAMKKKRNPSASELTEHELLLVEKTIAAIIAQDWEFISRVPKNALHNDENFREYVTIANLRSSDVPNNIADKIRVTITGSGEDMVQVLLRQTGGEHGVVLVFSRKHKTHDLRLHFLFSTDARPSAQPSEEAKDREGEIFAIAEERTRSYDKPTIADKDRALFLETASYINAYEINPARSITEQQSRLTDGEAAVVLGLAFILEVGNGGISQYLTNSSGDDAELALRLFQRLGIKDAASPLDRAKKIIFAGRPIPTNDGERYEIVSAWEMANEPDTDRIVREIEGHIGFGEQIESQLGAYVRLNPKEFPRSPH
jgi:hypothetical protein